MQQLENTQLPVPKINHDKSQPRSKYKCKIVILLVTHLFTGDIVKNTEQILHSTSSKKVQSNEMK